MANDRSINRPVLPENPKVKDINKFKKQLNWGESTAFYHLVAASVSELESLGAMGFDNALKRIINKHNWNLDLLGGYIDDSNNVIIEKKPRISLFQMFTDRGFEIHCYPFVKDKEIDQYVRGHRLVEFNVWDPGTMKLLCRVNQLHKFIDFYFKQGDEGDKALIDHTANLVRILINYLNKHVDVVHVRGTTIDEYFELQRKNLDQIEIETLELAPFLSPGLSK
jgi:hypothetical protein